MSEAVQEAIDRFYWQRGPCCAGCDWWHHLNSRVGECRKGAPVAASERWAECRGLSWASIAPDAGHIMTPRDHSCGDFQDQFDWSSLPLAYLARIGHPRGAGR